MSPEEREMLLKSVALAEENNKMLHSLTRSMRWGRIARIVYWTLIIGSMAGAYYFIQPYAEQILGIYGSTKSNVENVNSIFDKFRQ
ncbi:MAG: hypothetical protein UX71_C0001G0116 [Parcubacteria group bacterium GW2011_GWA1_47_10]|nr:MAG: hypothetical protein UX71_C0001G0116 [Parcubacteria group bacterium GW2011_GWA1_47_10]KKU97618.1 MAG: hypothetical protein UY30_C0002G0008 [Parcubacteria group bacterium GW2011_GWB1_48_6]